ncbi:hypothetical protein HY990_07155 [Candidatus Micrarchaeota archaeon]|nr:hypothetical protein [Candidatus Micrarchaeota archaeon]
MITAQKRMVRIPSADFATLKDTLARLGYSDAPASAATLDGAKMTHLRCTTTTGWRSSTSVLAEELNGQVRITAKLSLSPVPGAKILGAVIRAKVTPDSREYAINLQSDKSGFDPSILVALNSSLPAALTACATVPDYSKVQAGVEASDALFALTNAQKQLFAQLTQTGNQHAGSMDTALTQFMVNLTDPKSGPLAAVANIDGAVKSLWNNPAIATIRSLLIPYSD